MDACTRSPPQALKSSAEEGYGTGQSRAVSLHPVSTLPWVSPHQSLRHHPDSLKLSLLLQQKSLIICAFRPTYKWKLQCAKLSHQPQHHSAEVQSCQVTTAPAAQHPPLATNTTSHLVTECTKAVFLFCFFCHVQLLKNQEVELRGGCCTQGMLH